MFKGLNRLSNLTKTKGLTMAEMLIVISVIAILAAVIIPVSLNVIENSRKIVCEVNRNNLMRHLIAETTSETFEISDTIIASYLFENGETLCPNDGTVSVIQGELICSIHDTSVQDEDDEVPYLKHWDWMIRPT